MYYDKINGEILQDKSAIRNSRKNVSFFDFGEKTLNGFGIQTINVKGETKSCGRFETLSLSELKFDQESKPYFEYEVKEDDLENVKLLVIVSLENGLRNSLQTRCVREGFDDIISASSWINSEKFGIQAKELIDLRENLWVEFEEIKGKVQRAKSLKSILKLETAFLKTLGE